MDQFCACDRSTSRSIVTRLARSHSGACDREPSSTFGYWNCRENLVDLIVGIAGLDKEIVDVGPATVLEDPDFSEVAAIFPALVFDAFNNDLLAVDECAQEVAGGGSPSFVGTRHLGGVDAHEADFFIANPDAEAEVDIHTAGVAIVDGLYDGVVVEEFGIFGDEV